jgi:hypothetical protein
MKTCEKVSFDTKKDAREELERIVSTNYKTWKTKSNGPYGGYKPNRWYLCDCGKYHLTSKPTIIEYE